MGDTDRPNAIEWWLALARGSGKSTRAGIGGEKREKHFKAALVLGVLILVGVRVGAQPAQIRLDSDIPAHIGAIRDAAEKDRWIPLDRSFPSTRELRDPRMGIFHGLHASIALVLDSDPADVWIRSGSVLSPFFILAFAWLFAQLGMGLWIALVTSCVFAAGAWSGKPLGLWGAIYPAQAALALGALSWAWFLRKMDGAILGSSHRSRWEIGAVSLGLSVLIHPFAWWAYCLILAHMVLVFLVLRRRVEVMATLRFLVVSGLVGSVLLLPVLRDTLGIDHGVHWQPAGVLFFSSHYFTLDPLVLLRWGGWSAPLALVMAVVIWKRWGSTWRTIAALSTALPLWTIALNPLLQPIVYVRVGYLSERLAIVAIGPALVMLALSVPVDARARIFQRGMSMVVLAFLVWSTVPAWAHSPYRTDANTRSFMHALKSASALVHGIVLSDPLTSYAVRATGPGTPVLLPVDHASPLDPHLSERVADLRRILSPDMDDEGALDLILASGATEIIVTKDLESLYFRQEFGFVPSNTLQLRLNSLLLRNSVPVLLETPVFVVYDISSWRRVPSDDNVDAEEMEGTTPLSPLTLETMTIREATLTPGDSLHIDTVFKGCEWSASDWKTIEVGLVDRSSRVPGILQLVSKVYRKVVLERSMKSTDRILFRWIPGGGYRCGKDSWHESRALQIPQGQQEGTYFVFARMTSRTWRPNRWLKEYLDDRVTWGEAACDSVIIRGSGE